MGQWQTFDHTADLGLRIHASDLPDLFRTAGEGLFGIILANRDQVEPVDQVEIALTADSVETLLIDWLNELIFQSETGHRFFSRFDVSVDPGGAGSAPSFTANRSTLRGISSTTRSRRQPVTASRSCMNRAPGRRN